MPFIPDSPAVGKISQPKADKSLNRFHIHNVNYSIRPGKPEDTAVGIGWSQGYEDAEGNYCPVNMFKGNWIVGRDTDLAEAIAKVTTGGSLYGETKTAMWNFLLKKEKITSGNIV